MHRWHPWHRTAIAGVIIACLDPSSAWAAEPEAVKRAEELFQQAKGLVGEHRYAEACPLFAESHALDPGGGTLLALALCYEKEGKLATALSTFRAALIKAKEDARSDRQTIAEGRIAALEPRISRISVQFAPDTVGLPGLVVALDGQPLSPDALAVGVTVDPGTHRLSVTADGRLPFSTDVRIEGDARAEEVRVPALEEQEAVAPPPAPVPAPLVPKRAAKPKPKHRAPAVPPPTQPSATRIAGYVVGGAGVVALGVGTYLGIKAALDQSDADNTCPDAQCSDSDAVELNNDAGVMADWATGVLIGGSVCVAGGLVLMLAFPDTADAEAWLRHPLRWTF